MMIQESIERATELHRAGRLQDAERLYRQILAIDPNIPDVLQLLGILTSQRGQHDAAVELIRKAIALNPGAAVYHGNLGLALDKLGRLEEASVSFQRALDLGSVDPNILTNFATNLRSAKSWNPPSPLPATPSSYRRISPKDSTTSASPCSMPAALTNPSNNTARHSAFGRNTPRFTIISATPLRKRNYFTRPSPSFRPPSPCGRTISRP